MENTKMSEKLWDLANLVTGFAVAQGLAMIFALVRGEFRRALEDAQGHWVVFGATIVFTGLYIWAIIWCQRAAQPQSDAQKIWTPVTCGRVAIVTLVTVAMLLTVWAHAEGRLPGADRSEQKQESPR
jgi:hypothetical protein